MKRLGIASGQESAGRLRGADAGLIRPVSRLLSSVPDATNVPVPRPTSEWPLAPMPSDNPAYGR
jgi:hypothetical protein